MYPVPLSTCDSTIAIDSAQPNNEEVYIIEDPLSQKPLISKGKEIAAQPTFGISSTSNYTIANLSGSINTPTIYTNASTASLNLQTEPFSNSIGSMISTLQCVDPTEVHIEGYLSPTDRLAERCDAPQEGNKKNLVGQLKLHGIKNVSISQP